jgi:uncharacterized protein (TIGR02231 family)
MKTNSLKFIVMKNQIKSLIVILFISSSANAQSIKSVKTKVDKATVYFSGASLFHTDDFGLTTGMNELIFEGVAPNLDQNSLQASGKGNFVIIDVKYAVKYNEQLIITKPNSKNLKAIQLVNDSIVDLGFTIEELNEQLAGLESEKSILINNRLMKGETKRDTLDMFKEALAYLRIKLNNINSESYRIKRDLFVKNDLLQKLNTRLQELHAIHNQNGTTVNNEQAIYQVIVTAMADAPLTGNVTISYFINSANWSPSYDIRATSNNKNITITQKAQLRQSTGVDWNNANLTLATSTPNQSTVKPELSTLYIDFYNGYKGNNLSSISAPVLKKEAYTDDVKAASGARDMEMDAQIMSDYTNMVENLIQTEYTIKLKYSIPSDGKEHLVVIQNQEIKAEYNFSAVPKLDANAFLLAKITQWEDLNLIPGTSRIFFDGSYLGQSYIDPNIVNDTLAVSFGRDKAIVMTRKKLKDKTKEKLIIDEKVMTFSYEISLKNTKTMAVKIDLEDQIPVSNSKDIAVKLVESDKANFNEETGKLLWDVSLKPNETKKITVTYEVIFPKDKAIAGL